MLESHGIMAGCISRINILGTHTLFLNSYTANIIWAPDKNTVQYFQRGRYMWSRFLTSCKNVMLRVWNHTAASNLIIPQAQILRVQYLRASDVMILEKNHDQLTLGCESIQKIPDFPLAVYLNSVHILILKDHSKTWFNPLPLSFFFIFFFCSNLVHIGL